MAACSAPSCGSGQRVVAAGLGRAAMADLGDEPLVGTAKLPPTDKRWQSVKQGGSASPATPSAFSNVEPFSPAQVRYYWAKMTVSTDKAKRIPGYRPEYCLESGMQVTEAWARWANLL